MNRPNGEEHQAIAGRIREEIARRHLSRAGLASLASISLSTLEKALAGKRPFTLATLVRLESALSLSLRPGRSNGTGAPRSSEGVAPDELGSYSRAAVQWLEGDYLTLRPSFGDSAAIYAYRTRIAWSDEEACLGFREAERLDLDFTQFGSVSLPQQSGHIYLVTNRHGQYRLIVACRPTITGEMHGVLTTLRAGRGAHLSPVSTPIALVRMAPGQAPDFGRVAAGDRSFARYRAILRKTTEEGFASFLPR